MILHKPPDPSPATPAKTAALAKTVRVDVDRLDVL